MKVSDRTVLKCCLLLILLVSAWKEGFLPPEVTYAILVGLLLAGMIWLAWISARPSKD